MPRRVAGAAHPALLPLLAVPVLLIGLIGLAGSGHSSGAHPAPTARAITIASFQYSPNPAVAKVGDTITVTNSDGTDHTVTADDHSFDTGKFSSGSKTFVVTKPGTVTYHCDVHNFMTGTIQVAGS